LQLSSFFFAETFEGKHAEKIERYTETPRGSSETERERERERDRGGCRRRRKGDDEDAEEKE
jgi:hypothetical protein